MLNKWLGGLFFILWVSSANGLEIENFKPGLVCTNGNTFGWVCHEVEDIYITGQSQCVFNKETIPCTWYGFSFDYKNYKSGQVISCNYTQTLQADIGNPEGILDENTNSGNYEFELDSENGHFFNPQYMGLSVRPVDGSVQTSHSVCKSEGKTLFEFTFRFYFPIDEDK